MTNTVSSAHKRITDHIADDASKWSKVDLKINNLNWMVRILIAITALSAHETSAVGKLLALLGG